VLVELCLISLGGCLHLRDGNLQRLDARAQRGILATQIFDRNEDLGARKPRNGYKRQ
jgi:hypothetical protein